MSPRRGVALIAAAACLWGTWSLVLRGTGLPASVTSPIVFALIGLAALPLAWREPLATWTRATLALLAANTLLDAINVVTFFGAMERTSVAIAVLTHYLAPILIALAAPAIDRTRVPGAPAAALVATGGLALVLQPWQAGAGGGLGLGAALGAISAFAYAGNVFIVRRLAPRIGAARMMALHAFGAAVLLAPLGGGGFAAISATDLAYLVFGSVVLGAGAGIAFVRGLSVVAPARAAVLTFLEPLVAVLCGYVAFGEPLGPTAAAGGALILGAGVWVVRASSR